MGIIQNLKFLLQKQISNKMDNFLTKADNSDVTLGNSNMFIAVGEDDCPIGSRCEGYQLGAAFKLGSNNQKTVTMANGEPLLVLDFELDLKEVNPNHSYQLSFGMENNNITESGTFYRDLNGDIRF